MKKVLLDGNSIVNAADLHSAFAAQLSLPAYYGNNLDALYDVLTDLHTPVCIELKNEDRLAHNLGNRWEPFLRLMQDLKTEKKDFTFVREKRVKVKQSLSELLKQDGFACECGKTHFAKVQDVVIEAGALKKIPELIRSRGAKKVFVFSDENTYAAAGETVLSILDGAKIPYAAYRFPGTRFEPDERAVGAAVMHFDASCDMVITVGTGTLNDIGKIVANVAGLPYMIVGTAPSMDGYASATSSMIRDGLKVSLNSKCPEIVLGDLDVLAKAPLLMIQAGIGDMAAKYVSICEWQLSRIINGEYYCSFAAELVGAALKKCADNAAGLVARDPDAVKAVMEGLVLAGIAANYAGVSRPVSGMEHYISHIWDMRALEFGAPSSLHGVQVGIATVLSLKVMEYAAQILPNKEKALAYAKAFNYDTYKEYMVSRLGKSADAMIENEEKEHKYAPDRHAARLKVILDRYEEIQQILRAAPSAKTVRDLLAAAGAPLTADQIGLSAEEVRDAFILSKDIRDKYVLPRLLWDLGELDEAADLLFPV